MAGGAKEKSVLSTIMNATVMVNCDSFTWFRFANGPAVTFAPFGIVVTVWHEYNNDVPEIHRVLIMRVNSKTLIKPIFDLIGGSKKIQRIRLVYDDTEQCQAIDVGVNCSGKEEKMCMSIDYNRHLNPSISSFNFVSIHDTSVGTLLAEHTFKSNSYMDGPDTWPITA